jgi:hypothetical protein
MRKVLIGTPCYDGRTDVWYNNSMNNTLKLAADRNIEIVPIYMSYDALVQRARNDLVALALNSNFTDLIFIDSDQEWEPEWIFRLLEYRVDVVGGAVRKKTDDYESYNVRAAALPIPIDIDTGLLIVDGLGTGFMRLSRRALSALWESSAQYTNEGRICRMIFDVQVVNGELVSEDNVVCQKLRDKGFSIFLDKNMTCGHIGTKKFTGNFAAWLKFAETPKASQGYGY